MNYIGSKSSLLAEIDRVLDTARVPADGTALDLFAGTGAVAQLLKRRGHVTYANDWQYYSYLTSVALIELNGVPEFSLLMSDRTWRGRIGEETSAAGAVVAYLNGLSGTPGAFYDTYCKGGSEDRQYFSRENGLRIQAIRDQIEEWAGAGLIDAGEKAWLTACLLESADKVANTASVYGAYLKHIKKTAAKPLSLQPLAPVESPHNGHRAFCMDGEQLLRRLSGTRLRLVYIDPPYNARQYNSNYHILETIARWDLDAFEPRGVTGLRTIRENRSDYCLSARVEAGFRRLLELADAEYVLFSYNNEGLASRSALEAIFADCCSEVHLEEIPYRRFRADLDGENRVYKGDSTCEYLILGRLKTAEPEAVSNAAAAGLSN